MRELDSIQVLGSYAGSLSAALREKRYADSVAGTDLAHEIDLVAAPDDPKDLFGMVGAPVPAL